MEEKRWKTMREVDLQTVHPDELVDINTIEVNPLLPQEKRLADFLEKIKNPYCFRCGKIVVKLNFSQESRPLEERLAEYLQE